MSDEPDPRMNELAKLKAILDARWNARQHVLVESLDQGMITWRRLKNGGFEVKLKPSID